MMGVCYLADVRCYHVIDVIFKIIVLFFYKNVVCVIVRNILLAGFNVFSRLVI